MPGTGERSANLKAAPFGECGGAVDRKEGTGIDSDHVTAPDGICVTGWVCEEPQGEAVTSSEPNRTEKRPGRLPPTSCLKAGAMLADADVDDVLPDDLGRLGYACLNDAVSRGTVEPS